MRARSVAVRYQASGDVLALFADHTFAVAGGELSCQGGEGQIPDEVGTVVAEKKGRSRLVTSNVSDLETALGACEDTDVNVVRTAGWFKPTRHGGLRGKRTDHVRFPQTRLDTITVSTVRGRADRWQRIPDREWGGELR